MLDAVVGSVIMIVAATSLLSAIEIAEQAIESQDVIDLVSRKR